MLESEHYPTKCCDICNPRLFDRVRPRHAPTISKKKVCLWITFDNPSMAGTGKFANSSIPVLSSDLKQFWTTTLARSLHELVLYTPVNCSHSISRGGFEFMATLDIPAIVPRGRKSQWMLLSQNQQISAHAQMLFRAHLIFHPPHQRFVSIMSSTLANPNRNPMPPPAHRNHDSCRISTSRPLSHRLGHRIPPIIPHINGQPPKWYICTLPMAITRRPRDPSLPLVPSLGTRTRRCSVLRSPYEHLQIPWPSRTCCPWLAHLHNQIMPHHPLNVALDVNLPTFCICVVVVVAGEDDLQFSPK
jgi:hypothetical protein